MSDELTNPNAPGPLTGVVDQAQASPPAPQPVGAEQFAGFQKRIDELTYRAHEAERRETQRVQELMQQNQQLLMSLATRQQPEVQQPQVDIDPERRRELEALMGPQIQQLKAQQAQFLAQSMNQQLDGLLGAEHPEVAARSRAIWNDAVAKGGHAQGFTPQAALNYARGELFPKLMAAAQQGKQVAAAQNWGAQAPQGLVAQTAPPPAAGSQQVAQAPDMDEDPEAASAYYAQRLGNKAF